MRPAVAVPALLLLTALGPSAALSQAARGARAVTAEAGSSPGSLSGRLAAILDEPPFDRALWGVAIADPSGRIVFERNGGRRCVPASNAKIVVTAAAAALLPPDYRFRTSVYAAGPLADGVVSGDLVLYGRGDPSLSSRFYPSRFSAFERLADALVARGVVRVDGDLVGDASWFDSTTIHPSWESYDLSWWYAAPVSALAFNDNSVDLRITPGAPGEAPTITLEPDLGVVQFTNRARTVPVDSARTIDFHRRPGTNEIWAEGDVPTDTRPWTENVSIRDGAAWAAAAFRRALEARGIILTGRTRATYDSTAYATARTGGALAEHVSPPLPEIIEPVLTISHNWYAEMLLKTLGRERTGVGSWDSGLAVERRFLVTALRVDSTQFRLADGSGLSHWNLITPRALVQILRGMRSQAQGDVFRSALPVAGGSGTLRYRYRGTGLRGRVRAKTGSIFGVNTLSGYVDTPSGTWTFSIQLNNHTASSREALRQIDAFVAAFAR